MSADGLTPEQRAAYVLVATALELPPELVPEPSGLIREEAAWAELGAEAERIVNEICPRLTEQYLIPALRDAGVPEPEQYWIAYGFSACTCPGGNGVRRPQDHEPGCPMGG